MKTKKAVPTTAQKNELHKRTYLNPVPKSSTKLEQIVTLLLALQTPLNLKHQKNGWQLFGVMLRQYIDLKYVRAE
jgi:hypothetical protein